MKNENCKLPEDAGETIRVNAETIMAIRGPVQIDSLVALNRAAERHKAPGTTIYLIQQGHWLLFEARPLAEKSY